MTVSIRPYQAGDAEGMSRLYRRSVENVGRLDYSAEQVAAWAGLTPSPERLHQTSTDGRLMLVAVDADGAAIGFIDLEADGHIDLLYCAPEVKGAGVAAALYDELERMARQRGVTGLYSEASEAARRFFLKRGFVELHRRDLVVGGVPIHNFAVEKRLA